MNLTRHRLDQLRRYAESVPSGTPIPVYAEELISMLNTLNQHVKDEDA